MTLAFVAGLFAVVGVLLGLAFAGSSRELAAGARVGGVDVGGLTQSQAVAKLDLLFSDVADDPVTFVAGERVLRVCSEPARCQTRLDGSGRRGGPGG